MKFEPLLKQLGFSQNEAKVYIASLEMGLSSAQDIAKKANLQRTTTYSILEMLVKKGIVGKSKVRGKYRYIAESPSKLLSFATELQKKIAHALPELEAIYNKSETKPKIVFYEGKHAIQNVYDDTLRERPDEILEWNTNAYFDQFPKDHAYISERMKLNIHAKRIAGSGSVWHTKHKKYDQSELAETLIVPRNVFWPEIEVNIYNNKVAFMNYAENMSVIIESKAIADAMRQAYYLSWLGAQTIEVK
ncbi:MAG: hypothetical protein HYV32_03470 [Candidatus Kerfeldbacteria bacterium]|nr:hypothetical protein [Candidatus Kerfeldbacteria bacterium]